MMHGQRNIKSFMLLRKALHKDRHIFIPFLKYTLIYILQNLFIYKCFAKFAVFRNFSWRERV